MICQTSGDASCLEKNDCEKEADYKPPNIDIELAQDKNFTGEEILEKDCKEKTWDESSISTPSRNDLNITVERSSPIKENDSNIE